MERWVECRIKWKGETSGNLHFCGLYLQEPHMFLMIRIWGKKKTRHPYDSGTGVVEESDPCEVNPKNFP